MGNKQVFYGFGGKSYGCFPDFLSEDFVSARWDIGVVAHCRAQAHRVHRDAGSFFCMGTQAKASV